eukprot:2764297-Alexandrium_andersonii.AAC.1
MARWRLPPCCCAGRGCTPHRAMTYHYGGVHALRCSDCIGMQHGRKLAACCVQDCHVRLGLGPWGLPVAAVLLPR